MKKKPRQKTSGFADQLKHRVVLIGVGLFSIGLLTSALIVKAEAQGTSAKPDAYDKKSSGQSTAMSRDAMLNSNVNSFADRLHKNGGSLEEWMKLVRFYGVLGKNQKALQALASAKKDLQDNPQAIRRLNRFAKLVGLRR